MDRLLAAQLEAYQRLRSMLDDVESAMRKRRDELFPVDSVVRNKLRPGEWCIVWIAAEQPADQLNCLFENGNCWYRRVDVMEVVKDARLWPKWALAKVIHYKREACRRRAEARAAAFTESTACN